MAGFSREDLTKEYTWEDINPDDPRVSGVPDDTHFNTSGGHEVLYLINTLMNEWDLLNIKSGHKMEQMLEGLPPEIRSQAEVKTWIKEKWKSYKFKKAKGKTLQPPVHRLTENSQERKVNGQDHHHYCAKCNSIMPCEAIPSPTREPSDAAILQALSGIHYFKRQRRCTNCNHEFETVEIDSTVLYELMRMKSQVDKFKRDLNI
jgi:hypothetical protein